jgi:TRAP-type C4-dicarboxylate transport system substrate-binding protein
MKKLFIILVTVLLIGSFILAGCSKQTTVTATVTSTATTTTTATATVKPVTLVFQSFDPEDSIWGHVFGTWFKELETQSGGRVKVETHWNGELVSLPEVYDAVVKDTLDIATHLTTMPAGRFPMDEIGAFSSLSIQAGKYSRVQWELHQEIPEMQAPYKDVKVIWFGNSWPLPLCTTAKFGPVIKAEDNKGMKEVAFGDWQAQLGASLGRTAVSLLPPETYSAFEKGVADGMQCAITLLRTAKFGEVLPNVTLMAGTMGPWSLIMNLDKWNALPADVQQYIDASSEKLVDQFDDECLTEYNNDLAAFPAQFGTKFYTIPPEELPKWDAARQPVFDKFVADLNAKGLPGTKLMSEWQRLEQQYKIK